MSPEPSPASLPSPDAPESVRSPSNVQRWEHIAFLHWSFEPSNVSSILPDDLQPHLFEDAAWVGITPFWMRVRPFGIRQTVSQFTEINVRTYVVGPHGYPGIWFLHMEVGSTWFTSLRALGLPYVRRHLTMENLGTGFQYVSNTPTREIPATYRIEVRPEEAVDATQGLPLFSTARWRAFHRIGSSLWATRVEHDPWVLRSASVKTDGLARLWERTGLPPPEHDPVGYFSPGVEARLSWPARTP